MKTYRIIYISTFILLINTTHARDFRSAALDFAFSGGYMLGVKHLSGLPALIVSPSLDPKMLYEGHIDFKGRMMVQVTDRITPFLGWETYPYGEFTAYTLGCQYKVFNFIYPFIKNEGVLHFGYETGAIDNQDKYTWTNGIHSELEFWLSPSKYRFCISLLSELMMRNELQNPYWKMGDIGLVPSNRITFKFVL